jgi:hypothetical protein
VDTCAHPEVSCLNPYEFIRKYRCSACGEVMMCACDEDFGHRFLPHQLKRGVEVGTQRRAPVTIGFQAGICNTCRGLPEESHPKAELYGRRSKILRYYWREIFFETTRRFAQWADTQGYVNHRSARTEHRDMYSAIEAQVVEEMRSQHERFPKYTYHEESHNEVITRHKVDIVKLDGVYVPHGERLARILVGEKVCSAEEFAASHFSEKGYQVLFTESRPFHTLFGVLMWLLIQDPDDPRVRIIGFGDRAAFEAGTRNQELVKTHLPEDFGTPGYATRRAKAIEQHLAFIPKESGELLWTFDYWVHHSAGFRQYLWAHRPEDVEIARQIVSILPVDVTFRILRYLVEDYWGRYTGWPDLLVYREREFFFAEVKSSKDKLSENQKNWIRGNSAELKLPFKLVKIHKKSA